jgi:hypothetical protein
MKLINRAFISRPYITDGDSHSEVSETLARVPFMWAIQTHYMPATDTDGAFIVASCKAAEACIQVPYAYEHSREGAHYVAAMALVKRECADRWETLTVLGSVESGSGYLFCMGQDGLNT